jgi:CDP-diacylglycerol--glycerol-3-phosphate 3-phosphatidyltransferase
LWFVDSLDPLSRFIASLLFAAASGLDLLDGWIARRQGLVTTFGKFVDPLADKLMAMSVMVFLVYTGGLPAWLVVLMLGRDFYISGLRTVAANEGIVIAAGEGGKIKTVFQLVGICCVLTHYAYRLPFTELSVDFHRLGMMFLYLSLAMSIYSAAQYTLGFRSALQQRAGDD